MGLLHGCLYFMTLLCAVLLASCANAPPLNPSAASFSRPAAPDTPLANYARKVATANPNESGIHPLSDGREALLARLALIDQASDSIDLQVYLFHGDDTGRLLAWHLYRAAERGVRVRVLLDDMEKRDDQLMASVSAHSNIDIRLFNAMSHRKFRMVSMLAHPRRANRRMHNKSMVVDGAFAIVGGRNIGDEYFSATNDVAFADLDVLLIGEVVSDAARVFDQFWNSGQVTEVEQLLEAKELLDGADEAWAQSQQRYAKESPYFSSLSDTPLMQAIVSGTVHFYWSDVRLLSDDPVKGDGKAKTSQLLITSIGEHLAAAQTDFFLVSPYFVPTRKGTEMLLAAVQRGVRVVVVTNSLASNDVSAVHGKYAKYRKQLLAGGVTIHEVKASPSSERIRSSLGSSHSSLHAKTFIVDRRDTFIGSFNFDPRSSLLNTEMGVFIENEHFAQRLHREFEIMLNDLTYKLVIDEQGAMQWVDSASGITLDREPVASFWRRFSAWLAGLLPIENLL